MLCETVYRNPSQLREIADLVYSPDDSELGQSLRHGADAIRALSVVLDLAAEVSIVMPETKITFKAVGPDA